MTQATTSTKNKLTQSNITKKSASLPKRYPCPQCQTQTPWKDNAYKPFCSERCKLIDLGAWANEEYRMPAETSPFSGDFDQ